MKLKCQNKVKSRIQQHTNNYYGGDPNKKYFDYIFRIGSVGFEWSSIKQPVVALSSCEAGYIGATLLLAEYIFYDYEKIASFEWGQNYSSCVLFCSCVRHWFKMSDTLSSQRSSKYSNCILHHFLVYKDLFMLIE